MESRGVEAGGGVRGGALQCQKVGSLQQRVSARVGGRVATWCLVMTLLLCGTTGCITSRGLANRMVEAPNHTDPLGVNKVMLPLWALTQTNFVHPGATNPVLYLTVPVGPPAAELKVIELPPRDYHIEVHSKVEDAPHQDTHCNSGFKGTRIPNRNPRRQIGGRPFSCCMVICWTRKRWRAGRICWRRMVTGW